MAMSTAPRKVGNVAWRLVNEDLAWTVPGDAPNDWEVLFDSIRDLVHPPNDRTAMISSPLLASPLQDDLPETSLPSPKINNAAADWHLEDVHVLEVIGGRYFWAYVGRKGMEKVKSITDDLLKALPSLQPCPRARVGAMVVVVAAEEKRSGQDEPIAVMRGRVVGVDGDEVTVFAMDHGSLKQVRMGEVYQWSEPVEHLYTAEAQAKLCCLAGVQAPPASVQAVEFALVTLTCLTRLSFSAGIMFTEMSDLDHVCHLMQCGPPSIRLQATRLLCNLSSIPKLSASLNWSRFVRPILERLVVLSQRQSLLKELDNLHRNMVVASLFSLTNIMYHKPANHRLMLHLQGHMVLLNLLRVSKGHYPAVCQAVVCALKPLYPNLRFLGWEESHMCDIRDDKEPESTEGRSPADQPTELNEDSVNDIQVFSDDEITYEMQRRMPLPLGEADEEEEGEGGPDGSSSGVSLPGPSSGTVAEKTGESETSVRLVPVDGAAVFKKSGRFYVYGTSVPVQDDQTHHLVPGTSIRNMGFDGILKIICGMLNSEGGIIYLGLTKEGRVQGLPLNREDRDCVRLGVDEMMNKLVPSVPFNQIRVYCIPVLSTSCGGVCDYDGGGVAAGGSDGDELEPLGNRVVVEIHVKSPKEMQFHMKDNWCFQRIGPVLHSLTEQEVRALVISQETKKYLPQLWSLQGRLHCLQQALQ